MRRNVLTNTTVVDTAQENNTIAVIPEEFLTETKQTELDTLQADVDKISTELANKTEAMQTVNAIQITPRPELPPKPKAPIKPNDLPLYCDKADVKAHDKAMKQWEKEMSTYEKKTIPEWEKKCKAIAAERGKWDTINNPSEAIRQATTELTEREKAVKQQAAQIRETAKNLRKEQAQINNEVTKVISRHRQNSPLLQYVSKEHREHIESHPIRQETAETVQTQEKPKAPEQARPTNDSTKFRQQWAAFSTPKPAPRPTAHIPTAPHTTAPKTHTTNKNKGEMER